MRSQGGLGGVPCRSGQVEDCGKGGKSGELEGQTETEGVGKSGSGTPTRIHCGGAESIWVSVGWGFWNLIFRRTGTPELSC